MSTEVIKAMENKKIEAVETKVATEKKQPPYTREEVLEASIKYFDQDDLAATTWINKYALRNKSGELMELTPDDMHRRMAREFARKELEYKEKSTMNGNFKDLSEYGQKREFLSEEKIFNFFEKFNFVIPQGSVMFGMGNNFITVSLSNCIVLPELYDSYGGILYADQSLAQLFKRRCGVGLDLSSIRPEGARVNNAAGTTTGAVSFADRFSNTTRETAQNGRRGALMLSMDIAHPDIESFILMKQDLSKVTGANVSVRLSDEFMEAVVKDKEYTHRFPIDSENPTVTKTIKAKDLWNKIIKAAHQSAEPGLIFWDRQHKYSTSSVYPEFKNVSTNPCSEIAMQGGDSCRLIAINLYNFVKNPFTKDASFDYDLFYKTTYESQRLMDDLVDLELECIDKILAKIKSDKEPDNIKQIENETWKLLYESGRKGRRTGLGFTALGDTVAALGFKFDSKEAYKEVEKIMKMKCDAEFTSSIDMSIERGSFIGFDKDIENTSEFVMMLKKELPELYGRMMKFGRRNISISTTAPTGSLSMLAKTSSGIEPVFMLSYKRRRKINPNDKNAKVDFVDKLGDKWEEFPVYHQKVSEWMKITGETDITKSPYHGSTANDIDWLKRVELQSICQKYITHSISSTINLPADVKVDEVGEIYIQSWKKGLKGITVYRDGSRSGVLISNDEKKEDKKGVKFLETDAPKRPSELPCDVVRFQNQSEKWVAFVGLMDGRPYEVFTGILEEVLSLPVYIEHGKIIRIKKDGKSRYDFEYIDKQGYPVLITGISRVFDKKYWDTAKMISGILRHGMKMQFIIGLITDITLPGGDLINTWKSGLIRVLKRYVSEGVKAAGSDKKCSECGMESLVYEESCLKCTQCGASKCG